MCAPLPMRPFTPENLVPIRAITNSRCCMEWLRRSGVRLSSSDSASANIARSENSFPGWPTLSGACLKTPPTRAFCGPASAGRAQSLHCSVTLPPRFPRVLAQMANNLSHRARIRPIDRRRIGLSRHSGMNPRLTLRSHRREQESLRVSRPCTRNWGSHIP
jgi:hypothetical protein